MKLRKRKKVELFDVVNVSLVIATTLLVLYPLYFCVIASFSAPSEIALGNVVTWVKGFTLDSSYMPGFSRRRLSLTAWSNASRA